MNNKTIFIDNLDSIIKKLDEIGGYREKAILKDLNKIEIQIEPEENNEKSHILYFIDKNENYFIVDTKDITNLEIIG